MKTELYKPALNFPSSIASYSLISEMGIKPGGVAIVLLKFHLNYHPETLVGSGAALSLLPVAPGNGEPTLAYNNPGVTPKTLS